MCKETDTFLRDILSSVRTIAMVGASNRMSRPSFGVFAFLQSHSYHVIGVNPKLAGQSVHGTLFSKSLSDVSEPIDLVDIFRNSQAAGEAVEEALALDPRPTIIWMQIGVRNEEAASRARALGLKVVMDRCLKVEIERLAIRKL